MNTNRYRSLYKSMLLDDVIPFWMRSGLIDRRNGGYSTSVDREGKIYNTDKSVWFQGRGLWTFSRLCSKYGCDPAWSEAARSGRDFLEKYCVDKDGRMFFQVTAEGKPLRKRRYMFSESFYAVGMAEYASLIQDKALLRKAGDMFRSMLGMYHDPSSDPYKITPKSFAETRSERSAAVPMVLISTAGVLGRCDPENSLFYNEAAKSVAEDMIRYHMKRDLGCVLENVLSDGGFIDNPSGRTVNPGHSCENAWFLMDLALTTKNDGMMKDALQILDWSLELGWDKEYGGFLYFVDISGRPCEQLEWDMKLWWVHNEALIATLMAFAITRDEKYWKWFEKIHEYTFAHFPDREFGEWYGYLHRDGSVSHTQKGSMWKGPYHLPRCLMICEELLGVIEANGAMKPVL